MLFLVLYTALCSRLVRVSADTPFHPEIDASLQNYQDLSTCLDNKTTWSLVYRNFYEDAYFGNVRCVKFYYVQLYVDFTAPTTSNKTGNFSPSQILLLGSSPNYTANNLLFGDAGKLNRTVEIHVIYRECQRCIVLRHPYANNGYGCTYWRRKDTLRQLAADGCEFVYDELCGTTPKYNLYDRTCTPETYAVLSLKRVMPPPPPPSMMPPTTKAPVIPTTPPARPFPLIPHLLPFLRLPPKHSLLPTTPTLRPPLKNPDIKNPWNLWDAWKTWNPFPLLL